MNRLNHIFSNSSERATQLFDHKQFVSSPRVYCICLAFVAMAFRASHVEAQVSITIGDEEPTAPAKGTLLDLNSNTKGGLLLTNVELSDLTEIPNSFPGMSEIYEIGDEDEKALALADAKEKFKGTVVYNLNPDAENGKGIYIWSGTEWNYYINGKPDYGPLPVRTAISMP
ncbi:MAG: hypothetical protein LBQ84_02910, partial [Flavobacteriaceae bacterium]|nr:hypothetical protein [Flavobacteriaceae bacterium]